MVVRMRDGTRTRRAVAAVMALCMCATVALASSSVASAAAGPDMAIDKSHTGDFMRGSRETYDMTIKNLGGEATADVIVVTDRLPAGMTFAAAGGSVNWVCNAVGQEVTCKARDVLQPGAGVVLRLTVDVDLDAADEVVNTATVFTSGDVDATNDADSDPTSTFELGDPVPTGAEMGIYKSHVGDFVAGEQGTYQITVGNRGVEATSGPTEIDDPMPYGLDFVSAEGPAGWACQVVNREAICTTQERFEPGETTTMNLTVAVRPDAPAVATNRAWVYAEGQVNPAPFSEDRTEIIPSGRDSVALRISGGRSYGLDEVALTGGNIGVSRANGRVSSVRGSGTYRDRNGGQARVSFDVSAFLGLPLYLGSIRIDDAAANIHLTTVLLFPSIRSSGQRTSSSSGWVDFSRFPWRFYSLAWTVVDRG